jgi:DNA polymerase-3 subunit delta'
MSAKVSEVAAQLERLPWHDSVWSQLHTAWRDQRWPHALLLHGPEGVGKYVLAQRLAHALLCDRPGGDWQACGACASCKLLQSRTHPDFLLIAPEEDKQQISIDQIRESCASLALTSYRRGHKVALIAPAHQMTLGAANSLLKTLEEPASNTTLILVTSRPGALLATLRSRCQQVAIRAPTEQVSQAWLAKTTGKTLPHELMRFVHHAPLRALAMADGRYETLWQEVHDDIEALIAGRHDVTHIAKRWANEDFLDRLSCVDHWLSDRIRASIVGSADPITGTRLPSDVRQLNISRLYGCLDRLRALQGQLTRTALQRELAADSMLIDFLEALNVRRI